MRISRLLFLFIYNYFMFVFTYANGFLLGNWKINLSHSSSNQNILHDSTIIRIDNKCITVGSDIGGELVGNYILDDNCIFINNIKISKIPSMSYLSKAMSSYKWIKLIQKQGINIKITSVINSVNDTYLFLKYESVPYDGDLLLKKID